MGQNDNGTEVVAGSQHTYSVIRQNLAKIADFAESKVRSNEIRFYSEFLWYQSLALGNLKWSSLLVTHTLQAQSFQILILTNDK